MPPPRYHENKHRVLRKLRKRRTERIPEKNHTPTRRKKNKPNKDFDSSLGYPGEGHRSRSRLKIATLNVAGISDMHNVREFQKNDEMDSRDRIRHSMYPGAQRRVHQNEGMAKNCPRERLLLKTWHERRNHDPRRSGHNSENEHIWTDRERLRETESSRGGGC